MGTTVKEKTNPWNKSCKKSVKRETELYKMVEAAVMDEKTRTKRKRNDQGSAEAAPKEKGRGGSKRLDRTDAAQPRRGPEQTVRSRTEVGSSTLGIH